MLRVTADVNGRIIGWIYIHNTGSRDGAQWLYDAATWDGTDGIFGIEGVSHVKSEPWYKLVTRVVVQSSKP